MGGTVTFATTQPFIATTIFARSSHPLNSFSVIATNIISYLSKPLNSSSNSASHSFSVGGTRLFAGNLVHSLSCLYRWTWRFCLRNQLVHMCWSCGSTHRENDRRCWTMQVRVELSRYLRQAVSVDCMYTNSQAREEMMLGCQGGIVPTRRLATQRSVIAGGLGHL